MKLLIFYVAQLLRALAMHLLRSYALRPLWLKDR